MTMNLFQNKTIKLSAIKESDAEVMAMWQGDSEYLRNVDTDIAFPQSLQEIASDGLLKGRRSNSVSFMLRTVQDDRLIGFVAIHGIEWNNRMGLLAIGIGDVNDRGKGYGREAIHLILKYAFYELNLHRVGLDVISYNKAAIELYKKDGFSDGRLYERSSAKEMGNVLIVSLWGYCGMNG